MWAATRDPNKSQKSEITSVTLYMLRATLRLAIRDPEDLGLGFGEIRARVYIFRAFRARISVSGSRVYSNEGAFFNY